jgi:membrane protease YdiL (CAAX protease family)
VVTGWETVDADVNQVAETVGRLAGLAVVFVACRCAGWRAGDYLALARPQGRYVLLGTIALISTLSLLAGIRFFDISTTLEIPETDPETEPLLVARLLSSCVVGPIVEELVIRGFLWRSIAASRLGVIGALAITSLLFGLVHNDRTWFGVALISIHGLIYGWLRWRTGSTVPMIALHAIYNSVILAGW